MKKKKKRGLGDLHAPPPKSNWTQLPSSETRNPLLPPAVSHQSGPRCTLMGGPVSLRKRLDKSFSNRGMSHWGHAGGPSRSTEKNWATHRRLCGLTSKNPYESNAMRWWNRRRQPLQGSVVGVSLSPMARLPRRSAGRTHEKAAMCGRVAGNLLAIWGAGGYNPRSFLEPKGRRRQKVNRLGPIVGRL